MIELLILVSGLAGFVTVYLGTPRVMKYMKESGIVAKDQQKEDKPVIPTSGGAAVIFGFLVAISFVLGASSLFLELDLDTELVLAALSSGFIITLIGLIDDLRIKEDQEVMREGLSQLTKMAMVLPAIFPLIAVGAGSWTMTVPFIDIFFREIVINWGLIYPLVLLPLGIIFVSNGVNILAGMNGLSTLMSIITSFFLGIFAYINGQIEAAIIAFSLSFSLLGFLRFNWYPASVLPGDSLTYLSGGIIFSTIVIGNMERFGAFIFGLYGLELLLKARSGFKAHSWGELENGLLKPKHDKIYSLTHPLMNLGLTEKQITLVIGSLQFLVCCTGLALFTLLL